MGGLKWRRAHDCGFLYPRYTCGEVEEVALRVLNIAHVVQRDLPFLLGDREIACLVQASGLLGRVAGWFEVVK